MIFKVIKRGLLPFLALYKFSLWVYVHLPGRKASHVKSQSNENLMLWSCMLKNVFNKNLVGALLVV